MRHLVENARLFLEGIDEDLRARRAKSGEIEQGSGVLPQALQEALSLLPGPVTDRKAQPGDIWRVSAGSADGLDTLAALLDRDLHGVMVSDQLWLAASDDIVLPSKQSATGDPMLLCLWRPVMVPSRSLVEWVCEVSDETISICRFLLGLTQERALLRPEPGAVYEGIQTILWDAKVAIEEHQTFLTGLRIIDADDPRLAVRKRLSEVTSYLLPWSQTSIASTLGPVLPDDLEKERKIWLGLDVAEPVPKPAGEEFPWAQWAGRFWSALEDIEAEGPLARSSGLGPGLSDFVVEAVGAVGTATAGSFRGEDDSGKETTTLPSGAMLRRASDSTESVFGVKYKGSALTVVVGFRLLGITVSVVSEPATKGLEIRLQTVTGEKVRNAIKTRTDAQGIADGGPVKVGKVDSLRLVIGSGDDEEIVEF